jgi:NAD(P)-binding Rossmann-like domain
MSNFTRREVLAAFLGLPAAIAACRSAKTPEFPAGQIVGASEGIGHRLRDGVELNPSPEAWQRVGVVIVGGGVAGLAAAWRLVKSGFHDFVLLELEPAPGGTARSDTSPLVSYPWGAHYLPAPLKENATLISLLDEMGILEGRDGEGQPIFGEEFICRDPEERVFYRGRWYEGLYLHAGASKEDQAQLDRFNAEINRWVAWRDRSNRRAFAIPIETASNDAEVTALDKTTMADWLSARNFDSPRLRWLVDYACRDDYGMTVEQTSAWAGLFYFTSRVLKPGAESQPLLTWPEGNGRLVAHLYGQVRDKVRLGWAAAQLASLSHSDSNSSSLDVIALNSKTNAQVGFHCDRAIFAAPQFLTPYLIKDYREHKPAHLTEFQYGTWMVANLFLKDRPASRGFPLAWDNVIYESPSLGYVVATHQRGLDYGPTVFTYYYPICDANPRVAREKLLSMDWQSCADVALTDLSRAHPEIRSLVERVDVMRWGHAMIRPYPGFIWGGARNAAVKPYRGIHFAHTDLGGVALFEEAFYHGVRAAEEVLTAKERDASNRS